MCGYRTCSRGRMQEKNKSCPGCSWFVCCAFAVLVPRSFHMNVQYVMCVCVWLLDEVLQDVREEDISQELVKKFDAEK